jgi:hypothetical protein
LVICVQRGEADETLVGLSLVQRRIDADALVEDEALPVVVCAAAFLKIFENTAIELKYIFKTGLFHKGRGFFTANAAGAESDNGLVF